MDTHDAERVALLSIRPEYARAIFAGRKSVEFRRSRLASDIEFAIVYATLPVGRVIGCFRVAGVDESTPDGLWRRFRGEGEIRRRDYFAYFDGAERAYGIKIADPSLVSDPLLLDVLSPGLRAPQSFQYLAADLVSPVIESVRRKRPRRPSFRPAFA